jgi:hypothetical protein
MGVALSMPIFSPAVLAMIVEVIIVLILIRKRFFPVLVVSRCCSIAGAKRKVGGVCGCPQVGKAAALRNRATGKKTEQVFVSAQGGEFFLEGPGRCSGISWQAVLGELLIIT